MASKAKDVAMADMRKLGYDLSVFTFELQIFGRPMWDGRCLNTTPWNKKQKKVAEPTTLA